MENPKTIQSERTSENNSATFDRPTTHIVSGIVNQEIDSETTRLLAIFPNEIWLEIFERLCKRDDYSNLGKASRLFGEALKSLRTKILFPEVFKIIAAQFSQTDVHQILLNSRLVCKYWETGVGSVLNSFSTDKNLVQPYIPIYNNSCTPFLGIRTYFNEREKNQAFLQHFDQAYASRNRNPFISGTVDINYQNSYNGNSFAELLLQVLGLYGHHVSSFRVLHVAPSSNLPEDFVLCYEQLLKMLHLMPNLKELSIGKAVSPWRTSEEAFKALQLHMQSCVLPELISLQRLSLRNMLPLSFFDALLRSYSHVTILDAGHSFTRIKGLLNSNQMPNLTQLALALPYKNSLTQLATANVTWPLTDLKIKICSIKFDWEKLFQLLKNRWAATLTNLQINISADHIHTTMKVLPCLELPNLKKFLLFAGHFISMDFILPMSNSLEHLGVWYFDDREQDLDYIQNENVVKLYSFRRNLTQSNIWTLFPKLKNCYYYDWHVRFYHVSNQRVHDSKNGVRNCFAVQRYRDGQDLG